MTIQVETLTEANEAAYEAFLKTVPSALLFYSLKYKTLLERYTGAQSHYLIAKNGAGEVTGVLPLFFMDGPSGRIVNSSPFYGSNGGVLLKDPQDEQSAQALLDAYMRMQETLDVAASTYITHPMVGAEAGGLNCENLLKPDYRDERIGQITSLPMLETDPHNELMAFLHQKTRNMVRKAIKLNVQIEKQPTDEALTFLYETHKDNMAHIGGRAKPWSFFQLIPEVFTRGEDYEIFTAYHEGAPVAALLLFYYNQTVEYFTPVIVSEHRSTQSLSLLIFESMREAAQKNYRWWNWGGTWKTQEGVYKFKKSWGAQDYPYFYYTSLRSQALLNQTPEALLDDYASFYTVPFSALHSASKESA